MRKLKYKLSALGFQLSVVIFMLMADSCPLPASTVDAQYSFTDYSTHPLNVKRLTVTPLGPGADYNGSILSQKPIIYTALVFPTMTNGTVTVTNLVAGYAYRVAFSDGFSEPTITNYFGTNLSGTVGGVTNRTTFINWQNGVAVGIWYQWSTAASGTVQTNISYLAVTNSPWVSNYTTTTVTLGNGLTVTNGAITGNGNGITNIARLDNSTSLSSELQAGAGTGSAKVLTSVGSGGGYLQDNTGGRALAWNPSGIFALNGFFGLGSGLTNAGGYTYASLLDATNAAISNTRVQLGNGTNTIVSTNFFGNGIALTNLSGTNIIGTITNNTTGNAATATTTRWTNSTSYFVDANGIDANDGKSSQRAKLTLTNAVSTAGSLGTIYASGILNTSNHVTITNAGGLVGYGATIVNKRGGLDGLIGGHHIQLSGVTITNATDPFETSSAIGSTYLSANIPFTNGIFRDVVAYGDGDVAFFKLNHPATAEFHNCSFFGKYDDFVSAGPLDFHFYGCKFSAIGPSVFGEENVTAYQSNGFATENSTNTFYGCSFVGRNSTYNYAFNGVGGRNTFNACSFFVSSTNTVFGAYETYGLSFTGGTNYLNGCVINIPFDPETSAAYAIAGGGTGRTFLNNVILDPIDLQIDNSTATMVFYVSGGNIRPENFNSPAYVIWSGYTNPKMRTNGLGTVVANITLTLTNQDGSVYEVAARRIVP